jgi:hypothetical protein
MVQPVAIGRSLRLKSGQRNGGRKITAQHTQTQTEHFFTIKGLRIGSQLH